MKRGGALVLAAMAAGITFTHLGAQTPARQPRRRPRRPLRRRSSSTSCSKAATSSTPRNKISAVRDVAVKDGKVAAVAADIAAVARGQDRRCVRPVRHSRPHRHPRPRLPRREEERLRRRRLERLPRRLHAAQLRDDGGRRRQFGVAHVRRLQDPRHRSVQDPRHRLPQHRRRRHGIGRASSRTSRTWRSSRPRTWRSSTRAWSSASRARTSDGPEWTPYEKAEEVGRLAGIPVMVDFGSNVDAKRSLDDLLTKYFRPATSTRTCTAACAANRIPRPRVRARR